MALGREGFSKSEKGGEGAAAAAGSFPSPSPLLCTFELPKNGARKRGGKHSRVSCLFSGTEGQVCSVRVGVLVQKRP